MLRRGLLTSMMALATLRVAQADALPGDPWKIWIKRGNTGEEFRGIYRIDVPGEAPRYHTPTLLKLSEMLRDTNDNAQHAIDPFLFDLLSVVGEYHQWKSPIQINSGYRTARTQSRLANSLPDVPTHSFHNKGQAADIWVDGFSTDRLRDIGRKIQMGGVGYYPRSRFVHVDTGPLRQWVG